MRVALVKCKDQTLEGLRKAIEMCGGFDRLKPGSKVVIKPNMVMRGAKNQRPDGNVTLVETVEAMILLLREQGCSDITVADGGIIHKDLRLTTPSAFKWAGYEEMAERLGVPLIDLNEDPYETLDFEGVPVRIAKTILDAEFLIDIPVLKTHGQTQVSLGIKNLKGALAFESKKDFHRHGLARMIALLGKTVKVDLTVIDGNFGMQKGPTGDDVHQVGVLIAGTDIFDVDIVASQVLGIDPTQVDHLRIYAELVGRSLDPQTVEVVGESISQVAKPLEWEHSWIREMKEQYNIKGINMEQPSPTCCSACAFGIFVAISSVFREIAGTDCEGVTICSGKEKINDLTARKVICLGKCPSEANAEHPNAVKILGCPPSLPHMIERLKQELSSDSEDEKSKM